MQKSYKKSMNHFLGLIVVKTLMWLGIGFGVSLGLMLSEVIEDDVAQIFPIALAFGILGLIWTLLRCGNSISTDENFITITTLLGKKHSYLRKTSELEERLRETRLNGALLCYTLNLSITGSEKKKTWRLAGYPAAELENIFEDLFPNSAE